MERFPFKKTYCPHSEKKVSATQCIPGTCTLTSCWQQGGVEEKMSVAEQKGTSEASDFMV